MNGKLEELKDERKIIRKILILDSRKPEEGYRIQTKKTTGNHRNLEIDIRKRRAKFYGQIHGQPVTRLTKDTQHEH